MAGQQHVAHTAEEWRQLIDEQRRNGESQDAFCAARGLCKSTLQAWKRRLYGKPGAAVATVGAQDSAMTPGALFTPLMRAPAGSVASSAAGAVGWMLELEFGGGLCLRVRRES